MDEVPPILVVEDEPLIRLAMTEALQEGGYVALEAEHGRAAIDHVEGAEHLRGLVTDIKLGSAPDGWEVAHRVRERFPALAVVYVTGDSIAEWPAQGVPQKHDPAEAFRHRRIGHRARQSASRA